MPLSQWQHTLLRANERGVSYERRTREVAAAAAASSSSSLAGWPVEDVAKLRFALLGGGWSLWRVWGDLLSVRWSPDAVAAAAAAIAEADNHVAAARSQAVAAIEAAAGGATPTGVGPWAPYEVNLLRLLLRTPVGWGWWPEWSARHFPGRTPEAVQSKAMWLARLDPAIKKTMRRGVR